MSNATIKERIAKLLAKAEHANTSDIERDTFMRKVNELLEEYQLEIWEVRDAGQDPLGHGEGEAGLFQSMPWSRELAWAVAKYYYVKVVFTGEVRKSRKIYDVIGRESCRMTFELMLPFVVSQIRQQARKMVTTYEERGAVISKTKAERYVANALIVRIRNLVNERGEQVKKVQLDTANDFTGRALVLVDEAEALMGDLWPAAKAAPARSLASTALAKELAGKVSLNHQATGNKTKLLA